VSYRRADSSSSSFLVVVEIVVLGGGCDVIDIQIVVRSAPVFVRVVKSADGSLLDRTSRTALLFAWWLAFVFWRRIRPEVAVS
jgi:hypothetical protein